MNKLREKYKNNLILNYNICLLFFRKATLNINEINLLETIFNGFINW
jgi:hypothetical protein